MEGRWQYIRINLLVFVGIAQTKLFRLSPLGYLNIRYPSSRAKATALRLQHFRQIVMSSELPRKNLKFEAL
jgi:hypothetical protein